MYKILRGEGVIVLYQLKGWGVLVEGEEARVEMDVRPIIYSELQILRNYLKIGEN